ncbi:MAG: hypothetical protein JWN95_79 [Frankiales bacterium]|nr:hypothetical protein [Frankiales bacterium]
MDSAIGTGFVGTGFVGTGSEDSELVTVLI